MTRLIYVALVFFSLISAMSCDRSSDKKTPLVSKEIKLDDNELIHRLESVIEYQFAPYKIPDKTDFSNDVLQFLGEGNLPYVVFGDFNGDNLKDIALMLKGKFYNTIMIIAFHQTKEGYFIPYILNETINPEQPLSLYIQLKQRGNVRYIPEGSEGNDRRSTFYMKTEGIIFGYYEKAGQLFFWNDRKFKCLLISD